jgi:hypothetical protein
MPNWRDGVPIAGLTLRQAQGNPAFWEQSVLAGLTLRRAQGTLILGAIGISRANPPTGSGALLLWGKLWFLGASGIYVLNVGTSIETINPQNIFLTKKQFFHFII